MSKPEGISLRTIHFCLILLSLGVSCFLILSTRQLSVDYETLSSLTDRYLQMHKAATELMDATDHLSEMVQRYTLDGDSRYMHAYFEEALVTRQSAITRMFSFSEDLDAIEQLHRALDRSSSLMDRDYYAMRLVAEATGMSPLPVELQDIELQPQHAALPAREKKETAQHMVSDEKYYRQKDLIRADMQESLSTLESRTRDVQTESGGIVDRRLRSVRIVSIVEAVAIMIVAWLLLHLGITPIIRAVDRIKDDRPLPIMGAREFRYLAETYNKMYEVYKSSVANLNFKANHDELTGTYNRTGYEVLLSKLDLSDAAILLIDIDLFKHVNDTYGHEIGDRVLQKVAAALTRTFRSSDYVCRIGGDEFVVLVLRANRSMSRLIEEKVCRINADLSATEDGLPPVTVSAGAAFGPEAGSQKELFEHADQALYETKRRGRNGISFYGADKTP